jgi:hypothetical protein
MAFTIPSQWTDQTPYQVQRPVRCFDLQNLIENDRYICATRRPGYDGAWPNQSVTGSGEGVATLDVYRPANGSTVRLYVWGDGVDVTITDGGSSAVASVPWTGAPSLAYCDLTGVASGWVKLVITVDKTTSPASLTGWQLVDLDLDAGDLPA